MKARRAFRPSLLGMSTLEHRVVPTTFGVVVPSGVLGLSVTLPSQVPVASQQVQTAFTNFDASYIKAVDSILLAPDANGIINPSANRTTFNAAVESALESLAEQLVLSLSNGSTTTTTTTTGSTSTTTTTGSTSTSTTTTTGSTSTSTVSHQVVSAIVGSSTTSLESELEAISTTAIQLNLANVTSVASSAAATPIASIVTAAETTHPTLRVPVAEETGVVSLGSTSTSSSSSSQSSKAINEVRSAFNNFLSDYFQAVRQTLLTPSATGQANRTAFDTQVSQAIKTLESRIESTISSYSGTNALGPQIQNLLQGNNADSLKSKLSQLPTPDVSQTNLVQSFNTSATQIVAQALSLITGDISAALSGIGR